MNQKSNITVTKEREVKTYVHMWHTSDVLLYKGLKMKQALSINLWQVVNDLFRFRNDIAHGKSENIKEESSIPLYKFNDKKFRESLNTKWESYCTKEKAQKLEKTLKKL